MLQRGTHYATVIHGFPVPPWPHFAKCAVVSENVRRQKRVGTAPARWRVTKTA